MYVLPIRKPRRTMLSCRLAVKAVAEALGDTGRILVREPGTEPAVRVMVKTPDPDTCQKYVSQVVETIKGRGYGVLTNRDIARIDGSTLGILVLCRHHTLDRQRIRFHLDRSALWLQFWVDGM